MNLVIESTGPLVQERDRRDDRALLKVLARACRSGVVAIEGDCVRLQHIHSPVMSQADGNQWVLAIGAVFGLIWWFLSLRWALGVLPIGIVLYWTIGRKAIWRRLMRRVAPGASVNEVASFHPSPAPRHSLSAKPRLATVQS